MVRCIKCSYLLVLLPKRAKYKCSKCGSLFPQIDIENKEFRDWNRRQRLTDIENIKLKRKPRLKLTEEEKKLRAKEHRKIYYEKNKEKVKNYVKDWRSNNKERRNKSIKIHRKEHLDQVRIRDRLGRLRQRQKALALEKLKEIEKLYLNSYISYDL